MQGGFKRCDGELVDAQSAKERIAADALDEFFFPGDNSGLRTTQQFVSAEGHDVAPASQLRAHERLGDAVRGKIGEAARAKIFVDRQLRARPSATSSSSEGAFGESGDAEIGGCTRNNRRVRSLMARS